MNGNTSRIVIAICLIVLIAAVSVVTLSAIDATDTEKSIGAIMTLVTTVIVALLSALVIAIKNTNSEVADYHKQVNGQMTRLLATTERASHAEGFAEGIEKHETGR